MKMHRDILVIEDDEDDREILQEIFRELGYKNKIVFFADSTEALEYIRRPEVNPFIIISDINMPKLGGFELRNIILDEELLSDKDIPYIFISNAQDEASIRDANKLSIQGYIHKSADYNNYREKIKNLIDYWKDNVGSFKNKKK
ncbi:histidine kinase [Flavobacterium akiainvivens]|uniref:Histidine kinase n=1 Tax=Flavobacterium akiainvivens TaxID=1202724 RepID=A0A0M8MHG6_9FLAO|nr:response regulator [Flavobacterium akiainvivens]KOS05688.1 histidine kinase [Flavobacterium akiainvivens]SFQ36695.1 Response regulator receiver domain-containing protein [Flavobacterium akiainvivens]